LPYALFLIFYFRQLIDHLTSAFLKVGRFRVNARIVFCATQRVLSYTPAALASSAPDGNTASDCTIHTKFLTWRSDALESAPVRDHVLTKFFSEDAYALRYPREGRVRLRVFDLSLWTLALLRREILQSFRFNSDPDRRGCSLITQYGLNGAAKKENQMEFVDLNLARRLEMAEAQACRACAEAFHQQHPEFAVAVEEIAGGFAVFAGVDSPVTQAIGVGLHGDVRDADLDRLQDFFSSRGAAAAVELCPLVEMSLYERFAKRGFHLLEVSDVLFKKLAPSDGHARATPSNIVVRRAAPDEAQLWTKTVAEGFAEHNPVTQAILDVMAGFFPAAHCFLALVNGSVAGGGAVSTRGGVCGLFGASTLPEFRGRGVQMALLQARIAWATAQGCHLAVSITQPGSASHRNMERQGFRTAYTRTKLIRALS
jgi:GNAT superfamily N-acetyltransferase